MYPTLTIVVVFVVAVCACLALQGFLADDGEEEE